MKKIAIAAGTLAILSGLPGAGKSRLRSQAKNLPQGAWISADDLRDQILGTIRDLGEHGKVHVRRFESANTSVFAIMTMMVRERLAAGFTTVVDATNLTDADRKGWADIAAECGAPVRVLIVDTSLEQCLINNRNRATHVPEHIIHNMNQPPAPVIPESAKQRAKPGKEQAVTPPQEFMRTSSYPYELVDAENTVLVFGPHELEHPHYDVVTDIHGLLLEFLALLAKAGWVYENGRLSHPQGRKLLVLGDLVDRGPYSLEVLALLERAVADGVAIVLRGNHDHKLMRFYDQARRDGVERWGSHSNAETGMKLLSLKKEEADRLVNFIRRMPTHVTWERDKIAFVHADVHRFDPLATPAETMMYGDSARGKRVDSDAEYAKRFEMGLNEYLLIRGHIPPTSTQQHVLSLERHAFQKGQLLLLRLDDFIDEMNKGWCAADAMQKATVVQESDFDYDTYSKKFDLLRGMESLVTEKLATRQLDDTKLLRVYKYSKATFWNNSWGESDWLIKARGMVLDVAGNIVSHPFDKCFNYGENGTGLDIPDDTEVIEVEKLNGFLGIVSAHPTKRGELLAHTQGGFGGPFVDYINAYLQAPKTRGLVSHFLSQNDVTLMFEVLHPDDPHIIFYPPEMMGLHLLGVRGKGLNDAPWTETQVDEAAAKMGLRRPKWVETTFGETRKRIRDLKTEGVMIRLNTPEQPTVLKWKTPYYLTTKFLGRLSDGKIGHMYGNPKDFKKTVDEEFYPIVDKLVETCDRTTFAAMSDDDRVPLVRQLIDLLQ